MKLLLDSNRYSDFVAGDSGALAQLQLATAVVMPTIVLGELRAGFLTGSRSTQNEATLGNFLRGPRVTVAAVDVATTYVYARLMAQLKRQGTPIPTNDVWIAALAVQHGLTLFTRDKHFDHLPQVVRV